MAQATVPVGTRAPAFTLPSATGAPVSLEAYQGRLSVVLVFLRNHR